jgi:hypothetical protein
VPSGNRTTNPPASRPDLARDRLQRMHGFHNS